MADTEIRLNVNENDMRELRARYGLELTEKVKGITRDHAILVRRDAKKIIKDAKHIDTGRLINSITASVKVYSKRVTGEVTAGTKYARFIHEGADHMGGEEVHPHFVPFSKAPGLFKWAERNGKIVKKRGGYYFVGKDKDGNEKLSKISRIYGGMRVMQKPVKFFEKPFEEYAHKYVEALEALFDE